MRATRTELAGASGDGSGGGSPDEMHAAVRDDVCGWRLLGEMRLLGG